MDLGSTTGGRKAPPDGLRMNPSIAPNFFVVGAMKAGTTMLASLLRAHPDIFVSPVKEPCFFCSDINARPPAAPMPELTGPEAIVRHAANGRGELAHLAIVREPAVYRALFAGAADRSARGECSTAYLYSEAAAGRIAESLPEARIVIILRNPVRRAFSEYLMNRSIGRTVGSFLDGLHQEPLDRPIRHGEAVYVRAGRYASQVERFLARFPADRVQILFFEETIKELERSFGELCAFLGVRQLPSLPETGDKNSAMVSRFDSLNRLLYRSHAKTLISRLVPRDLKELGKRLYYRRPIEHAMTAAEQAFLKQHLADDIRRLEQLIGRELRSLWEL